MNSQSHLHTTVLCTAQQCGGGRGRGNDELQPIPREKDSSLAQKLLGTPSCLPVCFQLGQPPFPGQPELCRHQIHQPEHSTQLCPSDPALILYLTMPGSLADIRALTLFYHSETLDTDSNEVCGPAYPHTRLHSLLLRHSLREYWGCAIQCFRLQFLPVYKQACGSDTICFHHRKYTRISQKSPLET